MGTQQSQQPLKVYLSDISPHSQAILEFFIASAGKKTFALVQTPEQSEAYIVDYDHPGSKEHWKEISSQDPKPCIALSIQDPENSSVHWVAKPITSQALIAAATDILKNPDTQVSTEEPLSETKIKASSSSPAPPLPRIKKGQSPFRKRSTMELPKQQASAFTAPKKATIVTAKLDLDSDTAVVDNPNQATSETSKPVVEITAKSASNDEVSTPPEKEKSPTVQQQQQVNPRWELLCGNRDNVNVGKLKENDNILFNSENYFLGTLIAGLRLARQTRQVVQIKYEPYQFYICYDDFRVFSAISPNSDDFITLCKTKVKAGQVNLHILNSDESEKLRSRIVTESDYTYDIESYVWTSALLTSNGRIPSTLSCETRHLLKFWPNFTRLETFPFAMKIASRWQRKPYRVSELAQEMDIPQRYVIAFYNAAIALSLFETDMTKIEQKTQQEPRKKNGFLSRLFSRLTKSEASS